MNLLAYWIAGMAVWAACWWLGAYIAGAKRRSRAEGLLLGLCLGVFGVLIEALLPTKPEPRAKGRRPTIEHFKWKPTDEMEETVGDWIRPPQP